MIIVNFCGGLGNQLFQYAIYSKLDFLGKKVRADLSQYRNKTEERFYQLDKLGISLNEPNLFQRKLYLPQKSIVYLIKTYLGIVNYRYEENYYSYQEDVLKQSNVYLDGYWQNPKYFVDIKESIISSIKFPSLPKEQEQIRMKMLSENSVFVHVRLGDYLNNQKLYGGICTKEYFDKAFHIVDERLDNPKYYGFSDDIDNAKKIIERDDICWINYNNEDTAYNDLYLMSSCKNSIISNSSFSWWGAFLQYNYGTVIAPSKWMNGIEDCGIWCDGWIKI